MIGKSQITLGALQHQAGMASSDYATDGGLGTSSQAINPLITPGIIYATDPGTDKSSALADNIVASSSDSQTVSAYNRVFVDHAANFYTFNGTTVTKTNTGSKTYTSGTTDMVSFALFTWVSSTDNLCRWNTSGTPAIVEDWWTNASFGNKSAMSSSNRHPLIVFEQLMWLADGSNLYNITSSGTIAAANWALSSNELITAFGIDPSTGLMMVAVELVQNYSDSNSSRHYVYLYDGFSAKPRRKIEVDEMVESFHNVGGVVYVGYGIMIGMWNGNGITFLRKLANAAYNGSDLPYKHHMSNVGNILLVIDGKKVLAYGEVVAGQKGWFPIIVNPTGSVHLDMVCHYGGGKIAIAYSSAKLYVFDLTTAGTSTGGALYYNNINFPRPVFIRRIKVVTTGFNSSNNQYGGVGFVDENFTSNSTTISGFKSATTKYVYDFDYASKVMTCTPYVTFGGTNFGVVRLIIYYDVAE